MVNPQYIDLFVSMQHKRQKSVCPRFLLDFGWCRIADSNECGFNFQDTSRWIIRGKGGVSEIDLKVIGKRLEDQRIIDVQILHVRSGANNPFDTLTF